jgi:perosamine synthetase
VIEDACEAIGAELNNKMAGSLSDCAVFAFYPNKQMTTGEGGMLVTDNVKIADAARSLRNQGRDSMAWLAHNRLGYNYRLSEINCALGLAQLDRLPDLLRKREAVAEKYNLALSGIDEIILPLGNTDKIKRSWFVYVIRLKDDFSVKQRDKLIEFLKTEGIGCNVYFPSIHLQPYLKEYGFKKGDFSITESISERTIALPFFNDLTDREINYITKKLKAGILEVKNNGR